MSLAKRSVLALVCFAFMLVVVGYINYKYDPEREKDLGQTVYVSTNDDEYSYGVSIYSDEETEAVVNEEEEEDTIAVFRYDRDNMFSELIETYNNIINNENTSAENINSYQEKLDALIEKKTLINMVENVIKSKGIEDIVIIPTNNDNLNVVVKSDVELEADMIAKIQDIIVEQLGVEADKLSITVSQK